MEVSEDRCSAGLPKSVGGSISGLAIHERLLHNCVQFGAAPSCERGMRRPNGNVWGIRESPQSPDPVPTDTTNLGISCGTYVKASSNWNLLLYSPYKTKKKK